MSQVRYTDPDLGAFNLPHTPLRHNQGASALLISDTIDILTGSKLVESLFLVNSMFLLWIIAQGILGLIENQWDQTTVRNWAFRTVAGTTPKQQRIAFGSRLRYYFGKIVAGYYFVVAIAVAFICPFVFVSSVIINEFVTWSWPVSESEDAVGQVSCSTIKYIPRILMGHSGVLGSVPALFSSPRSSRNITTPGYCRSNLAGPR